MGIIIFTGNSDSIFFRQFMSLLNLDTSICMAKIKSTGTSETVCHGNSSETFEQKFVN